MFRTVSLLRPRRCRRTQGMLPSLAAQPCVTRCSPRRLRTLAGRVQEGADELAGQGARWLLRRDSRQLLIISERLTNSMSVLLMLRGHSAVGFFAPNAGSVSRNRRSCRIHVQLQRRVPTQHDRPSAAAGAGHLLPSVAMAARGCSMLRPAAANSATVCEGCAGWLRHSCSRAARTNPEPSQCSRQCAAGHVPNRTGGGWLAHRRAAWIQGKAWPTAPIVIVHSALQRLPLRWGLPGDHGTIAMIPKQQATDGSQGIPGCLPRL